MTAVKLGGEVRRKIMKAGENVGITFSIHSDSLNLAMLSYDHFLW